MNSPIKLDRRQIHKNEEDKISMDSSKKTASNLSFPLYPKSNSSHNTLNKIKHSAQNNSSTIDSSRDKKKNMSPIPHNGKSSVDKNRKLKKLTFRKKFVDLVMVESYKKYNIDLSYGDPVIIGEKTRCRKMQKEFEKNFEYMSQEMTRIYLQNTENEYKSLEENFLNIQKIVAQKILSKCGNIVGKISLVSESVNQMENETLQITLKPKPGEETEFDTLKNELFVCAGPYMAIIDYDLNYKKYFEKLNDTSYSLCLKDCKKIFSKKFSENQDDIKFDEIKYCLRDCYNLSTFNFRSYYDSFMKGLDNDLEEIKKL